ncbi:olfactory receptor 13F1-like [Pelobates fuscus]|uniref:olfactory receptor 13F1-like n=1 Tax=Pelobates fuscus TaxID=191477 RepID=UPI002FE432EB
MGNWNQTSLTEFILTGLSLNVGIQLFLFVLFLLMYILTVCGNIVLICTVIVSSHMHTPMYYFLCNLSFLDLFYISITVPKMLSDIFIIGGGRISFIGCMIQMDISLFLGETECILLAVMAYDRYVAICLPLHYMVIMSRKVCKNITIIMWLGCFTLTTLPSILKPLTFCSRNKINHFTCESLAILELACGDTSFHETLIFFVSIFTLLSPFAFILTTYLCIIRSILNITSVTGRNKAFSTCASHLTVVLMFYGTSMNMYMGLGKAFPESQKYVSIIYVIVTPMLNPLIYSLRNNDVKVAVKKMFGQ